MKSKKGFSLIELLIVIAIIGILAALAVPKYRQYTLRSRYVNVMNSLNPLKQDLAVCATVSGTYIGCSLPNNTPGSTETYTVSPVLGSVTEYLVQQAFRPYVKEIGVAVSADGAEILLAAVASAAFNTGATTNPTYILKGQIKTDGSQTWAASGGTCVSAGLCNIVQE